VAALEELIGIEDVNALETIHSALLTLKSAVKT